MNSLHHFFRRVPGLFLALFHPTDDKCVMYAKSRMATDENTNGFLCVWVFSDEGLQVLLGKGDIDLAIKAQGSKEGRGSLTTGTVIG